MNCNNLETLVIETDNSKDKEVRKHFMSISSCFWARQISYTNRVLIDDINLNLLDFYFSRSVKIYVNELFKNSLLTLINRHTHVTTTSIFAIDHINKNFALNSNFNSGIIKTDLSDHFNISMTCEWSEEFFRNTEYTRQIIYKEKFSEKQIEQLKLRLHEFDCTETVSLEDIDTTFDEILSTYYNTFYKVEITLKIKLVLSPWIKKINTFI